MPVVQRAIDAAAGLRSGSCRATSAFTRRATLRVLRHQSGEVPRAVDAPAGEGRRAHLAGVRRAVVGADDSDEQLSEQQPVRRRPYVPDLRRARLRSAYGSGGEPLTVQQRLPDRRSGRVLGRYDKHVLIPFGEYIPGASLFPSSPSSARRPATSLPDDRSARSTCRAASASRR